MSKYIKCPDCKKLSSLETVFPVPGGLECPHCGIGSAAPLWIEASHISKRDEELSQLHAQFAHASHMYDQADTNATEEYWLNKMTDINDAINKLEGAK